MDTDRRRLLREVAALAGLAIVLSWTPLLVLLVTTADPQAGPLSMLLWALVGLGQLAATVLVVWRYRGREGLVVLGRSLTRWRVGRLGWLLLAPLPVGLAAVWLLVGTGRAPLEVASAEVLLLVPVWLVGAVLFGGLEEVGWRGHLQPLLQRAYHPTVAAVVVALIWSLWHLPLFWLTGTTQAATSILTFTLGALGLSVVLGWAWNASGGSTLLAVLLHGAVNGWYTVAVQGLAPTTLEAGFGTVTALVTLVAAAVVLLTVGPQLGLRQAPRLEPVGAPDGS